MNSCIQWSTWDSKAEYQNLLVLLHIWFSAEVLPLTRCKQHGQAPVAQHCWEAPWERSSVGWNTGEFHQGNAPSGPVLITAYVLRAWFPRVTSDILSAGTLPTSYLFTHTQSHNSRRKIQTTSNNSLLSMGNISTSQVCTGKSTEGYKASLFQGWGAMWCSEDIAYLLIKRANVDFLLGLARVSLAQQICVHKLVNSKTRQFQSCHQF